MMKGRGYIMTERLLTVVAWAFCCAMGTLARIVVVNVLGVWNTDGTMAVSPWVFAMVDAVPLFVAGAIYLYIYCCPADVWGGNNQGGNGG